MQTLSGEGQVGEVLVVALCPTQDEIFHQKPFSSYHHKLIRRAADKAGVTNVRYEYLYPTRVVPESLYINRTLMTLAFQGQSLKFKDTLKTLKPKIIVAIGPDVACALRGAHSNLENEHTHLLKEGPIPLICTFDPLTTIWEPINHQWLYIAFAKARKILDQFVEEPIRVETNRTSTDYLDDLDRILRAGTEFCFDLETAGKGDKSLILTALSWTDNSQSAWAMSKGQFDEATWNLACEKFSAIISSPRIRKINQNLIGYDLFVWWKLFGCVPAGELHDTQEIHTVTYPEFPRSLNDIIRMHFIYAPWKGGWKFSGDQLRTYAATDALLTYRAYKVQLADLERAGMTTYYNDYLLKLASCAMKIEMQGIPIDTVRLTAFREEYAKTIATLKADLVEKATKYLGPKMQKKPYNDYPKYTRVGEDTYNYKITRKELNEVLAKMRIACKDFKHYMVANKKNEVEAGLTKGLLYKKAYAHKLIPLPRDFNPASSQQRLEVITNMGIKVPTIKQAKVYRESTGVDALTKIIDKKPEFIKPLIDFLQSNSFHNNFCNLKLDPGDMFRFSYYFHGTKSGRSSSAGAPWGVGGNAQNFPRGPYRRVVVPALKDHEICQVDLSQAEARVVAWLAREEKLIALYASGADVHSYTAAAIFNVTPEEIIKGKKTDPKCITFRNTGKKTTHAKNYDMSARTFQQDLLTDAGIHYPLAECQRILDTYDSNYPSIPIWKALTKHTVQTDRKLVDPFGKVRPFFSPLTKVINAQTVENEDLVREALSFIPQSTVVTILNKAWIRFENEIFPGYPTGSVRVMMQCHDSLLFSIRKDLKERLRDDIDRVFNAIRFQINGYDCHIPHDLDFGPNWHDVKG
jgi:DNA polymerase I-like protein with 3'-5' exonuclease and polymerase domains